MVSPPCLSWSQTKGLSVCTTCEVEVGTGVDGGDGGSVSSATGEDCAFSFSVETPLVHVRRDFRAFPTFLTFRRTDLSFSTPAANCSYFET